VTIVPVVFVDLDKGVSKTKDLVTIIMSALRMIAILMLKVVVSLPIYHLVFSLLMLAKKLFAIKIGVVLKSLLTAWKEDITLALKIVLSLPVIRPALINTFVSYLPLPELKNSPQLSF